MLSSSSMLYSTQQTDLKAVLADKIIAHQSKVAAFRKEHGNTVIQQTTVDMVCFP